MTTITKPAVFAGLTILTLEGYKPEDNDTDSPGGANWLCEEWGMSPDGFGDATTNAVLWTDYDHDGWRFAVLLRSEADGQFAGHAEKCGYRVVSRREVTEPENFGDGSGVVAICKHPEGWVILG